MKTDPVAELAQEYSARRERVLKPTCGRYAETRNTILGASDDALVRVKKARETLLAIDRDAKLGDLSSDKAAKLRKAVLDDARGHLDKTARGTERELNTLPDRLVTDAFPLALDRTPATSEAKADLDRELSGIDAGKLPAAVAETVRRHYAEGDSLAADLLLSAHGRSRLKAAGVQDAEAVHAALRRELASQLPTPPGKRGEALAALAQSKDWTAAYTLGMNAADMQLRDLEGGRLEA